MHVINKILSIDHDMCYRMTGMILFNYIAEIGANALKSTANIGETTRFIMLSLISAFRTPFHLSRILEQIYQIGIKSLPIVAITASLTGAVLTLQTYVGFSRINGQDAIASVVVMSMTRELGPVLVGLILSGKVGSYIAAQIGTMKITEQLEALSTLSCDSTQHLIAPRIIASSISLPILVLIADIIGIYGGYLVATYKFHFDSSFYVQSSVNFLKMSDIFSGMVKATFFGFIIATMGCYHGYKASNGAKGVGMATTQAVVSSSIMIIFFNYVITYIFFV